MELIISAVESPLSYDFTVTDGTEENTFFYSWGKEPSEGQTVTDYLQQCKSEALLLAEHEIKQKQPPTELTI
jgi:hypothetical protein